MWALGAVIGRSTDPGRQSLAGWLFHAALPSVVELTVEHASAKVRTGGPVDDADDIELAIWAGVVPITQQFGAPVTEPDSGRRDASPAIDALLG